MLRLYKAFRNCLHQLEIVYKIRVMPLKLQLVKGDLKNIHNSHTSNLLVFNSINSQGNITFTKGLYIIVKL